MFENMMLQRKYSLLEEICSLLPMSGATAMLKFEGVRGRGSKVREEGG